jgi:DNA-directed RNA polymerase specialized sigma subunit
MGFLHYRERRLPELISEAQAQADGPAIRELLRRFEPLTKSLGRKLAAGRSYRDDIESAARFALVRAATRHRGSSGTFPGYAKRYMSGAALRELQRWSLPADWSHCQLDAVDPAVLPTAPAVDERPDLLGFGEGPLSSVMRQLRPEQQTLLARRYVEDAMLSEIAADHSITVSAISQRLDTAHRAVEKGLAA